MTSQDHLEPVDIAVVGGGPAGWAVAQRAAVLGLTTTVIDPGLGRAWPQTFGVWVDEIPGWLSRDVVLSTTAEPAAFTTRRQVIGRPYAMLSTPGVQAALTAKHSHIDTRTRSALATREVGSHSDVLLEGGATVSARVVVDCSGHRRVVTAGSARGARASQTASGVIVPDQETVDHAFMDWRGDHGHDGWPTFLYAVPMGEGPDGRQQVLLEETSLARRPGLDVAVLQRRLHDRLAARGILIPDGAVRESVRFVVDTPPTAGTGRTFAFGTAAPTMHPATGYSLGSSLGLVDDVVAAVAEALPNGLDAAAAGRHLVWPASARLVHHLRRRGLEAVLALPPLGVVDFFEVFFSLPAQAQKTYLSDRHDPAALMRVMWQIFMRSDNTLRRHLVRWGFPPGGDHRATSADAPPRSATSPRPVPDESSQA